MNLVDNDQNFDGAVSETEGGVASSSARMKSAMIVYALEQCIGNFVREEHLACDGFFETKVVKTFVSREELDLVGTPSAWVEVVIAASFLNDVIDFASEVAGSTGKAEAFSALAKLIRDLDIYSIRNAISHPNRPFPESYWYRSAAIASDSTIDILGFDDVRKNLRAAEQNKLVAPPEEWVNSARRVLPNNLPDHLEHHPTGLIGRTVEKRDLHAHLRSRRYSLLALVAPGGVGKTALVLELLKQCSLDETTAEWCDGILFITLKQEQLTAQGFKFLDASQSIDEIKEELVEELGTLFPNKEFENLDQALAQLGQKKMLICIDNLETLLRDQPTAFAGFYETMPEKWHVILTSRITVDGAKSISLKELNEGGAKGLAKRYFQAHAVEPPSEDVVSAIFGSSNRNPLAIRLTIDRYLTGEPLQDAKETANKDIVAFSYKNLLEALSDDAKNVLECLFVREDFDRSEIVEILNLTADEAAEAVKSLSSTSLVNREQDGDEETLVLTPSIRDLLREFPANLSVRSAANNYIDHTRSSIQQHKRIHKIQKVSPYHEDAIPDNLTPGIAGALVRAVRILRIRNSSHSQILNALTPLKRMAMQPNVPGVVHLTLARLYERANDNIEAEKHYVAAIAMDDGRPTARILFATFLGKHLRHEEALEFAKNLIQQIDANESSFDPGTASRIYGIYFWLIRDSGNYELLLSESDRLRGVQVASERARLAKAEALVSLHMDHKVELIAENFDAFLKAFRLLDTPVNNPGVRRSREAAWRKSLSEFFHFWAQGGVALKEDKRLTLILDICENFFREYISKYPEDVRGWVNKFQSPLLFPANNPFCLSFWKKFTGHVDEADSNDASIFREKGYEIVRVTSMQPRVSIPGFMFAEGEDGERFFISRSALEVPDLIGWARVEVGDLLAISDIQPPPPGRDMRVPDKVMLFRSAD